MNTLPPGIDYLGAQGAIDAFDRAESMTQVMGGLDALAASVGLPNYLALHLDGSRPRFAAHRTTSRRSTSSRLSQSDLVSRLLVRIVPVAMDHDLGIDALRYGIAASVPSGSDSCVVFMGRPEGPMNAESLADLMGIVTLATAHLLAAMTRIARAACPLSTRELQCLFLATNGLSAKATARRLGISQRTVENHLARCRTRLAASTTLAAALEAARRGWLSFTDLESGELPLIGGRST